MTHERPLLEVALEPQHLPHVWSAIPRSSRTLVTLGSSVFKIERRLTSDPLVHEPTATVTVSAVKPSWHVWRVRGGEHARMAGPTVVSCLGEHVCVSERLCAEGMAGLDDAALVSTCFALSRWCSLVSNLHRSAPWSLCSLSLFFSCCKPWVLRSRDSLSCCPSWSSLVVCLPRWIRFSIGDFPKKHGSHPLLPTRPFHFVLAPRWKGAVPTPVGKMVASALVADANA